jgi:ribonucleoside-diphosphate reductase alpha chain
LYRQAHALGVKCVSYYRDGSRDGQVLTQITESATTPENANHSTSLQQNNSKVDVPSPRRPAILRGATYAFAFPDGDDLYVTCNCNPDGSLAEVFTFSNNQALISPIVGKLITLLLKPNSGIDIERVIKTLWTDKGDQVLWVDGRCLTSASQAIAYAMRKIPEFLFEGDKPAPIIKPPIINTDVKRKPCPQCSATAWLAESGCFTCTECGYSKCG